MNIVNLKKEKEKTNMCLLSQVAFYVYFFLEKLYLCHIYNYYKHDNTT